MGGGKSCSNCGSEMKFLKRENVQLGQTGWILGDLPNLVAGALNVEIWHCPRCRKLDFYLPEWEAEPDGSGIAQIICPHCGAQYDMDAPKCPCCGAKNARLY